MKTALAARPARAGFSHKMGLYFRKGIGLGPLVLFWMSGIGISAGVRGLRARVQSNRRLYTSACRLPVTRPAIRDVFTVATMPGGIALWTPNAYRALAHWSHPH